MSVYTKKDGRVYVVYSQHGRRVWESFGRGEKALNSARLRDLALKIARLRRDTTPGLSGPSPTFREVCQLYINDRRGDMADSTRKDLLGALTRYVMPIIGGKRIGDITLMDWSEIQNEMMKADPEKHKKPAGNATINKMFRYLNPIMKWAVAHDLLAENPWRSRIPLKQKKFNLELLSLEEFRRILAVADDDLAWVMKMAYYTGMRPGRSELFALTWDNVDFENSRIRIFGRKTDHYRWQYLPDFFMAEMRSRFERGRIVSALLCLLAAAPQTDRVCTYNGRPIKWLRNIWIAALEEAKITRPIRLYDIRHFHITHALAAGAPMLELAERVGHKSAQMIVKVYAHMVEDLRSKKPFDLPSIEEADPGAKPPDEAECRQT